MRILTENKGKLKSFGLISALAFTLSACSGTPVGGNENIAPEAAQQPTSTPTPETLYEPTLYDYTFTDDVIWDDGKEEYLGEEGLEDSDIKQIEELLLLLDSYDQASNSPDYVTQDHVDSLKSNMTDRLHKIRTEGAEFRTDYEVTQGGEVVTEKLLVTYYQRDSEVNVSACRDFSDYSLTSLVDPEKNIESVDFDEDVREVRAIRADGKWIILGQYPSDHTCDDIRNA